MRNFRNYEMWQDALKFIVDVYVAVKSFPSFETYALGDQIRRASVSIASNIAEGSSRVSEKEYSHFLQISLGSAFEVETQLCIANQLGYIDIETLDEFVNRLTSIEKQLGEMIRRLTRNSS